MAEICEEIGIMMKTICIITQSLSGGGAEKIAVNLIKRWVEKGIFVHLNALINVQEYNYLISVKVKLHNVSVFRVRNSIFALVRYIINLRSDVVFSVI